MRRPSRARFPLALLGALLLAAAAAAGHAETVKEAEFEVTIPEGFVASPPALAEALRGQLSGALAGVPSGTLRPADTRVWAYERPSPGAAAPERAIFLWMPGDPPAADEPSFRDGLERGLRAAGGGPGPLAAFGDRRLPGDVEALEARVRMPTVNARMRLAVIPRAGFLLMIQHVRVGGDDGEDDAAWETLLAGFKTSAGAPSAAARRLSYPQWLAVGAAAVVVLLIVRAFRDRGRAVPVEGLSPDDDDPDFRPRRPRPPPG